MPHRRPQTDDDDDKLKQIKDWKQFQGHLKWKTEQILEVMYRYRCKTTK